MTAGRALKVLYIGESYPGSMSRHNWRALERNGHSVFHINQRDAIHWNRWTAFLHWRTGFRLAAPIVRKFVLSRIPGDQRFDLIWIHSGEDIDAQLIEELRKFAPRVVNYNCDDPSGPRDGNRWATFLSALSKYDLCAVVRNENAEEFPKLGAQSIVRVWMAADEVSHRPRVIDEAIRSQWSSDVCFVGTWMPERGELLAKLVERGVPLSIWGSRWNKAPEWRRLRHCWKGPAISGDEYAYAIQCAKICLGLVSHGNRDQYTMRSAEIPSLGGLLCAERTKEHMCLYNDGVEAAFWSDVDECCSQIFSLLGSSRRRDEIAAAGHRRFLLGPLRVESVTHTIVDALFAIKPDPGSSA